METVREIIGLCESEFEENIETLKKCQHQREELLEAALLAENRISQMSVQCQELEDKVKVYFLKTIQKENLVKVSKRRHFQMTNYIQQVVKERENEEQTFVHDVQDFEAEVDKLIDWFKTAGIFYGVDNLLNEKVLVCKEMEELTKQKNEFEKMISFYKMKIPSIRDEFNSPEWQPIQNLFEQETQICKQQLEFVKSQYSY